MTRRLALAALVPLSLTAVMYAKVARFDFIELDDPQYVYANPTLADVHGTDALRYAFTTFTGGNYHPLVWLSFLFDRWAYHLRPGPMHVENAALHAASGVLVLLLLADATGALGRATVCAALFAVHPMHVESVAWISERKDALSTAWLLAAACAYVRFARTDRWGWYAALIGCYALSLSAKSMGVTLPFLLLLLDAWPLDRLRGAVRPRVREKLPLLAMALATSAVTVVAQRSVGATAAIESDLPGRLSNAAVSFVRYLGDLFWPSGLAPFYPLRPVPAGAAVASLLILLLITAVAVRVARRRPYLLVGWLWFAGTLAPVSGVVQIGMQAMADRYVYFPSIGLSIAVVWLAADLLAPLTWVATATAIVAVSALTVAGRVQVGYWRDNLTLFTHTAAVTDDNYRAWDALAHEAINRNDLATAESYLGRAIQARPDFAAAYADLGRVRSARGQASGAVVAFAAAVNFAPASASYRTGLALSLDTIGKHAEAIAEARRAVAIDPGSADARSALAALER